MRIRRILYLGLVFVVTFGVFAPTRVGQAAALTSLKDVLSTLEATVNANHTVSFVAPSAIANNTTITLTFAAGFDLTGIIEDDLDIAGSTEGELTTAADCTGAEKAGIGISGQVITITLCSGDGGDFTNSETVTIEIGNHAAASGTGTNQINNPSAGTYTIAVAGSMADSGTLATSIIADDSVNITSTVDPTITFTISDTTVGFGTLTTANARWATGNLAGVGAQPAASSGAHEMTVATNAVSGYAITYNGATLTSGGNTISVATIAGDGDGTPGIAEQFAMAVDDNGGNVTIVSDYDYASNNYRFIAGTTTQFASETGPTLTETLDVQYIANILPTTEPGTYTTNVTYVATGTF